MYPRWMPLRDVVGHTRMVGLLARALARDTLPPSLLLAGPAGVGKRRVAVAVAAAINCLNPQHGELERDGNLVYVNAGHQPPILFFKERQPGKPGELELTIGGTVIGPLPEARFRRGFARVHPGEVLLTALAQDDLEARANTENQADLFVRQPKGQHINRDIRHV